MPLMEIINPKERLLPYEFSLSFRQLPHSWGAYRISSRELFNLWRGVLPRAEVIFQCLPLISIYCPLIIFLFRINDRLVNLLNSLGVYSFIFKILVQRLLIKLLDCFVSLLKWQEIKFLSVF